MFIHNEIVFRHEPVAEILCDAQIQSPGVRDYLEFFKPKTRDYEARYHVILDVGGKHVILCMRVCLFVCVMVCACACVRVFVRLILVWSRLDTKIKRLEIALDSVRH